MACFDLQLADITVWTIKIVRTSVVMSIKAAELI